MTATLLLALWRAVLLATPSPALAAGPVAAAPALGDAGLVRRAEPRSELALAIRSGLVYDEPGFYGMADAGLELQGSWAPSPRTELFASLAAVQLRYVQNATLSSTTLTLGAATVGAAHVVLAVPGDRLAATAFVRALLPFTLEYEHALPIGVEPGVSLQGWIGGGASWHAGAALPLTATPSAGGLNPRLALGAVGGLAWSPWRWVSLVGELSGRFGPLDPLDTLAAGIGARFAAGRLGLELAGVIPFAGASRYTAAALVRGAWRLDAG